MGGTAACWHGIPCLPLPSVCTGPAAGAELGAALSRPEERLVGMALGAPCHVAASCLSGCRGQAAACSSLQLPLCPTSRTDSSITCTMPAGELTAAVPVCVQFDNRSCASHNITFKYEKNPVISDINPKKSQIR